MSMQNEERFDREALGEESGDELREIEDAEVYRDRWIRAVADLDNLRKRAQRDQDLARRQERERILADCLAVLDNLERALDAAGHEAGEWIEGVKGTRRQMLDVLSRHGVEPFNSVGEPFDPNLHEAVGVGSDPGRPEGSILEVFQKGYLLDGGLLRPARVIVNRGDV